MSYGSDLRAWRDKHLISQRHLALVAGVSKRTIVNIEGGLHEPTYTTRMRLKAIRERYKKAKTI